MEDKSITHEMVLNELKANLSADITFDSGKILGSMCTRPHPLAQEVFSRYIEKNIGDPGLCASTEKRESDAITMLSNILSLRKGSGHIVTGGTEANLLAIWTAKKSKKLRAGYQPEMIAGESSHFSFDKASEMLGIKLVKVGLTSDHTIDVAKVKKAVNAKTIAIVGVAGSTALGSVDPIDELSAIAAEKSIHLHIDAAFGGYVLPFLKELGYPSPAFDFKLKGVSSMTVDPHKMGMSVIPAGGIIYRTKALADTVRVPVPYLSGGESARATIVGTRSGASVLAVWALLRHLGRQGYRSIVRRCMEITHSLAQKIRLIDELDIVCEPTINILGIKTKKGSIQPIAARLRERGWAISLFPEHIRIVCMPHVYPEHIEHFTDELRTILAGSKH